MKIEVHVHIHHPVALESKLDKILEQQERIMATVAELKAELVALNATTDELAADVADLISKLGDPAALDEVKAGLVALKERLQGLAAQHTPST